MAGIETHGQPDVKCIYCGMRRSHDNVAWSCAPPFTVQTHVWSDNPLRMDRFEQPRYYKPVCRGSLALGTACLSCERCDNELVKLYEATDLKFSGGLQCMACNGWGFYNKSEGGPSTKHVCPSCKGTGKRGDDHPQVIVGVDPASDDAGATHVFTVIDEHGIGLVYNEETLERLKNKAADKITALDKIQDYRFGSMVKNDRYAFARGLTINPTHLPEALKAMEQDGWFLLSIFGDTTAKEIGFIFQKRPTDVLLDQRDAIEWSASKIDVLTLALANAHADTHGAKLRATELLTANNDLVELRRKANHRAHDLNVQLDATQALCEALETQAIAREEELNRVTTHLLAVQETDQRSRVEFAHAEQERQRLAEAYQFVCDKFVRLGISPDFTIPNANRVAYMADRFEQLDKLIADVRALNRGAALKPGKQK